MRPRRPTRWRRRAIQIGAIAAVTGLVVLVATCRSSGGPPPATPRPLDQRGSAAVTVAPSPDAKMRVHLIDVGQGAATLVEFSCAAILIDTGGESNAGFESTEHLMWYLAEFFRARPDLHDEIALLLLTHPHIDHTRNAMEVWRRYKIDNVVTDGMTVSSGGKQEAALIGAADAAHVGDEQIEAHDIPPGGLHDAVVDPVACPDGDPDVRVLWGHVTESDVHWSERALKNANNDSVVVKISLGKASLLVTGDLELDGIDALVTRYAGTGALRADVYEVGHHGSYNGTTKALLDAIRPKIALVAVGSPARQETWSAWAYGHPRAVTIDLLEHALTGEKRAPITAQIGTGAKQFEPRQITAPIFATGWDGNIVMTMYADGRTSVTTQNALVSTP